MQQTRRPTNSDGSCARQQGWGWPRPVAVVVAGQVAMTAVAVVVMVVVVVAAAVVAMTLTTMSTFTSKGSRWCSCPPPSTRTASARASPCGQANARCFGCSPLCGSFHHINVCIYRRPVCVCFIVATYMYICASSQSSAFTLARSQVLRRLPGHQCARAHVPGDPSVPGAGAGGDGPRGRGGVGLRPEGARVEGVQGCGWRVCRVAGGGCAGVRVGRRRGAVCGGCLWVARGHAPCLFTC